MKRVWQILKQHPIAIIVYIPYAFCSYEVINTVLWFHNDFKKKPGTNNIGAGEVVGFSVFFIFLFAIIFGVVILLNALYRKQSKFYWWLLAAIIAPLIIVANI